MVGPPTALGAALVCLEYSLSPILQISVDFSLPPWSLPGLSRRFCPADVCNSWHSGSPFIAPATLYSGFGLCLSAARSSRTGKVSVLRLY